MLCILFLNIFLMKDSYKNSRLLIYAKKDV